MSLNAQRVLKFTLLMCAAVFAIFVASRIMLRPERFSEGLLRMGGRIIKKTATNSTAVALFGGITVLTVWATIAIFAWRESKESN